MYSRGAVKNESSTINIFFQGFMQSTISYISKSYRILYLNYLRKCFTKNTFFLQKFSSLINLFNSNMQFYIFFLCYYNVLFIFFIVASNICEINQLIIEKIIISLSYNGSIISLTNIRTYIKYTLTWYAYNTCYVQSTPSSF